MYAQAVDPLLYAVPILIGAIEIQDAADTWLGVEGFIQILKNLNYPKTPLRMNVLEKQLLKFSNDIRLQDDITIIEGRFFG